MTIVYVTTEYPLITANYGGIAVVFRNEVKALLRKGHFVKVILVSTRGVENTQIPPEMEIFHFPQRGLFKGLRGRLNLVGHLNNKYDSDTIIVTADFGGILPFKTKAKRVTQLHECGTLKLVLQGKSMRLLLFINEYMNIKMANKLRSVSDSVINDSIRIFPRIKTIPYKVIHNGIPGFEIHNKDRLQTDDYIDRVIFVGKLSELKGAEFLASIINGVHKTRPGTEFLIIGHDELKKGHSQKNSIINKLAQPQSVKFFERIPNEDIGAFLRKCKVLILPSRTEALPTVAIEAFSCHTPVVAFNVGGVGEIIDHGINGYLVRPFEVDEFVFRVCQILQRIPEVTQMPTRAFQKFETHFKLETCINKLEEFYATL